MSTATVLFDAPGPRARRRHLIMTIVGVLLVVAVIVGVGQKMNQAGQLDPALWLPFLTSDAWVYYLIPGLIATMQATVLSVVLAGAFGVIFGMGRLSENAWIRRPCGVIVEFFRAVPVLIMMIFAATILNDGGWFVSSVNPLIAVVVALTLYNGSVIAELVRSGVHALPKGQSEAGLSIGLTPGQTLRSIELPQALVAMLPALIGQLVVVLKDTALGYGILFSDLLSWSKTLGSAYANTVPAYIVAALLYLVINYLITELAAYVERRLRRSKHTAGPVTTTMPNIIQGTAEPGLSATYGVDAITDTVSETIDDFRERQADK